MELNKTKNGFYIIIAVSVAMLLLIGSWWLFLVFKLSHKLEELNHPLLEGNLLSMIKWEGLSFLSFLIVLSGTLLYIYFQDHKKTKSLQAFFSSLTHELKTPLASIKLQTQVLNDFISGANFSNEEKAKISKYTQRLLNDGIRLEDQLDNHLQLSRVERKALLNLMSTDIAQFLDKESRRYQDEIKIHIKNNLPHGTTIKVDDFALRTILRNLLDNSIKHAKMNPLEATFILTEDKEHIKMTYYDNGKGFDGDMSLLGNLFYKHNSPKGSGIGIYLIQNLMKQMGGKSRMNLTLLGPNKNLQTLLFFKPSKRETSE